MTTAVQWRSDLRKGRMKLKRSATVAGQQSALGRPGPTDLHAYSDTVEQANTM
jgi:hypothetical protein